MYVSEGLYLTPLKANFEARWDGDERSQNFFWHFFFDPFTLRRDVCFNRDARQLVKLISIWLQVDDFIRRVLPSLLKDLNLARNFIRMPKTNRDASKRKWREYASEPVKL